MGIGNGIRVRGYGGVREKARENGGNRREERGREGRGAEAASSEEGWTERVEGCPFNVFLGCFCDHFCVSFFEAGSQAMESQRSAGRPLTTEVKYMEAPHLLYLIFVLCGCFLKQDLTV